MANKKHVEIVKKGAKAIAKWRRAKWNRANVRVLDLERSDLTCAQLPDQIVEGRPESVQELAEPESPEPELPKLLDDEKREA